MYAILALSGINIRPIIILVNFLLCHYSLLPLFSGASRIWQSGAIPGVWGQSFQPVADFYGFHIKNTHSGTRFIEKGRTIPAAVSPVL